MQKEKKSKKIEKTNQRMFTISVSYIPEKILFEDPIGQEFFLISRGRLSIFSPVEDRGGLDFSYKRNPQGRALRKR